MAAAAAALALQKRLSLPQPMYLRMHRMQTTHHEKRTQKVLLLGLGSWESFDRDTIDHRAAHE